MRRVAVIAYHSSPLHEPGQGDAGGMTVYVREVARALARRAVRTDIFTRATDEFAGVTGIFPGVRVVSIPAGPRVALDKVELVRHLDDFVSGVRAFSASQRTVYDVVHSHYWQSGLAAQELSAIWQVPLVHSHHTLGKVKNDALPPGDEPESTARLNGEAAVIAEADALIASTDHEWQQLACLYGASHDRVKTIYPGVDHSSFHPGDRLRERRALGWGAEHVLLYVGRIQPLKGLELAVRAVEQLVPVLDRDLRLVIVGGASGSTGVAEIDRLRRLATELGIEAHVDFVGPRRHDDMPVFYRAADAVVVSSFSESFGFSALEAHACGVPVVATDVGGLSYVVRDGLSGFLVGSRDPSVFAARLKTLLADDHLRASFSTEAARSAGSFSWERTTTDLADLYECLIVEQYPEACIC